MSTVKNHIHISSTAWLLLLFAAVGISTLKGQPLEPGLPPGWNFNLTNWYLGLPVDSSGGTNGDSASISAATLTAGYSNALYFYTGTDGAMTFWAPVTGATTPGSSYPRSELREQIVPGNNNINWNGYGRHTLEAQCKVTQVPSTGKVIIGQIHTKTGDARPLVKLQYSGGTIEALVKVFASDSMPNTDNKLVFENVGLGNSVAYNILMENGLVTVTVNGLSKSTNTFLTDLDWANQEFYFKAGSYCQDNVGPTNEGARVAFYALERSHAPSITNAPTSRTVPSGTNTTFNVSAAGNGTLQYQWFFNSTNLLVGAMGASLTLSNVQPANSGGYSVRVTDGLGSVTSSVASLTVTGVLGILSQPTSKAVQAGENATFSVTATGTAPLAYQWQKNGTNLTDGGNISGSLSNVLLLTALASDDAGNFRVIVTNATGSATSMLATLAVTNAPPPASYVTNVIVDDSFADGNRANTGALQADWWSSSSTSGNSIEVVTNSLGLVTGTSGRGIHGTFAPQMLAVGDTLKVTYTFTTPATVGNNLGAAFKIAIMDLNTNALAADLNSSSSTPNPLYVGLPGYMVDFDVNTDAADTSFREHDLTATSGRFLGTTGEWIQMGSSADAGYSILTNTTYTGVFSITRTGADSVDLFASLSQGATLLDSFTDADASGIANNFGMLGFWANGGVFGSSSSSGNADNGVEFSNIKIEVVTPAPVTVTPMLTIAMVGTNVVLSWEVSGGAGFELQASPTLTPPVWVSAGSPTVVGDLNHVTNAVAEGAKFYRLQKP